MRVLLDECLPLRLGSAIVGHTVTTVPKAGWASIKNGRLLQLIAGAHDAFITIDKNMPAQQPMSNLPFGVIVLKAKSNRIADVLPMATAILVPCRPFDLVT